MGWTTRLLDPDTYLQDWSQMLFYASLLFYLATTVTAWNDNKSVIVMIPDGFGPAQATLAREVSRVASDSTDLHGKLAFDDHVVQTTSAPFLRPVEPPMRAVSTRITESSRLLPREKHALRFSRARSDWATILAWSLPLGLLMRHQLHLVHMLSIGIMKL